jgi:serine/threonine protein kinase
VEVRCGRCGASNAEFNPRCTACGAALDVLSTFPARRTHPEPGARVAHYLVGERLGAGGMGVVYRARDTKLHRDVALKFPPPELSPERLEREAQAMARLAHPHVVTVHEVGDAGGGQLYIAMELVEGQTLRAWLRERPRGRREILDVFVAAGRGLAAAHAAGLVHRDFKPENVLVGADGRARVSDFGLARESTRGDTEVAYSGTPTYMAPDGPPAERAEMAMWLAQALARSGRDRARAARLAREARPALADPALRGAADALLGAGR